MTTRNDLRVPNTYMTYNRANDPGRAITDSELRGMADELLPILMAWKCDLDSLTHPHGEHCARFGGLVSPQEIAERLNVKKQTVHTWRARGILPEPDFDLGVGPVWLWETIEEWARKTGRL